MIEHLLIHRATIVDVGRGTGAGGARPKTRTTRAADVPCRRAPAGVGERQIALNLGAVVTHSIWFRPDQAVELDDEITIDGTIYFVRSPPRTPSVPIYKMVLVEERVPGA